MIPSWFSLSLSLLALAVSLWSLARALSEHKRHKKQREDYEKRMASLCGVDHLSKEADEVDRVVADIEAKYKAEHDQSIARFDERYKHAKKYVLHPGPVYSHDGDRHLIGPLELARLYKVDLADCLVANGDNLRGMNLDGKIHLHPSAKGDYTLPAQKEVEA